MGGSWARLGGKCPWIGSGGGSLSGFTRYNGTSDLGYGMDTVTGSGMGLLIWRYIVQGLVVGRWGRIF